MALNAIWLINKLLNTAHTHSLLISPSEMGSPATVWNSWGPPEKCKMTPHSHGFPKAPSEKPTSVVRNCSWLNTRVILSFLVPVLPPEHRCQMSRCLLLWWHQHLEQETQWRHIAAWSLKHINDIKSGETNCHTETFRRMKNKSSIYLETVKLQTIKSHNKDKYLPLCTSIFWSIKMQVLLLLVAGLHMVVDGIWSHWTIKGIHTKTTRAVRQEEAFSLWRAYDNHHYKPVFFINL